MLGKQEWGYTLRKQGPVDPILVDLLQNIDVTIRANLESILKYDQLKKVPDHLIKLMQNHGKFAVQFS